MGKHIGEIVNSQVNKWLDFPPELAQDMPKVTMIGNIQVYIDNHKGIGGYHHEYIKVNCRHGFLLIEGQDLILKNISKEAMVIGGCIAAIRYVDETL